MALRRQLTAFLAGSGETVYEKEHVPVGAACPYMTYEWREAGFGQAGEMTAVCWTLDGLEDCLRRAEGVRALLNCGIALVTGAGGALLVRLDHMDTVTAPQWPEMCGARLRFTVTGYEKKGWDEDADGIA